MFIKLQKIMHVENVLQIVKHHTNASHYYYHLLTNADFHWETGEHISHHPQPQVLLFYDVEEVRKRKKQ